MILLVASLKDIASLTITRQVLEHYPFKPTGQTFQGNPIYSAIVNRNEVNLIILGEESINAQYLTDSFPNPSLILFISRHSSTSGKPTLSVHTPGNLGAAEFGGLPRQVSVAPAAAMHDALKALSYFKEGMKLEYEVSYECTHHGPSLNAPAMFVELGSSPQQWRDQRAAEAVAHAAISAIGKFGVSEKKAVLGIGGTHYNERFTRMALDEETIFGHIIPKYAVSVVDAAMLRQCLEKTLEPVESAVLDWKGIKSADKPQLLAALQEIGLPYKKI
ncbi:MAG: D-aminoacyl-tRNA deacylase [Candidatus Bathyarchaeia archaeon]